MRIIKQGKLIKQVKCDYCKCEFEYGAEDIKEDYDYPYGCFSHSAKQKYVKCPECGNKIKVKLQGE